MLRILSTRGEFNCVPAQLTTIGLIQAIRLRLNN
jgi:hypothetical protein